MYEGIVSMDEEASNRSGRTLVVPLLFQIRLDLLFEPSHRAIHHEDVYRYEDLQERSANCFRPLTSFRETHTSRYPEKEIQDPIVARHTALRSHSHQLGYYKSRWLVVSPLEPFRTNGQPLMESSE